MIGVIRPAIVLMTAARDAWRAYAEHAVGCLNCSETLACSDGERLHGDARIADRIAISLAARENTCIRCGCTDSRACRNGCFWASVDEARRRGICSRCVTRGETIEQLEAAIASSSETIAVSGETIEQPAAAIAKGETEALIAEWEAARFDFKDAPERTEREQDAALRMSRAGAALAAALRAAGERERELIAALENAADGIQVAILGDDGLDGGVGEDILARITSLGVMLPPLHEEGCTSDACHPDCERRAWESAGGER